jgi:hypothetical protein
LQKLEGVLDDNEDGDVLGGKCRDVTTYDTLVDVIGHLHDADVLVKAHIPSGHQL